ncbi:MAG: hypothetical protein NTW28_02310 [Candidatus Solibacter sp.]|nr:hypothetical protein [Candidatus Solibacter sp.]
MTTQQQAFKVYYSSLTDAELLKISANKRSFLDVAQEALANELRGRNLAPSEPPRSNNNRTVESRPFALRSITRKARGWFSHQH